MIWYEWFFLNKEIFKIVFTLGIFLICLAIVMKTHRLFRLSYHQGIRYFRNAFLFYGLAFLARYLIGSSAYNLYSMGFHSNYACILFEFFIVMAGFFLIYSLLYKNFETGEPSFSSLFNARIIIFYFLALIIGILDYTWGVYYFMLFSQIILFSFAGGIAFCKYAEKIQVTGKKGGFFKMYLSIIFLNLIAWLLNFILASFFSWHKLGMAMLYMLNIIIFAMFAYAVFSSTKRMKLNL